MKKLFAIAIVTSFLFSGCFSSRLPTTQNLMPLTYAMERRYILVSTTYNWGSAVDIGNGYALTAGHVVYKDGTCDNSIQLLSANGSQGCFVVDTVSDVAFCVGRLTRRLCNFHQLFQSAKGYIGFNLC